MRNARLSRVSALHRAAVVEALPHAGRGGSERRLIIDAGVEHLRVRDVDGGQVRSDVTVPNHGELRQAFESLGPIAAAGGSGRRAIITGKLAGTARRALGGGRIVPPAEALWRAARMVIARPENAGVRRLALLELSASGYLLVGVEGDGRLADDLLVVNPRCGAGSGINLDRVLQKLAISREGVDDLLAPYCGAAGRARRESVSVRADRCGVFASSATISDKNQGIPLPVALATTIKSEVLKACRKLPAGSGFDKVYLSGRIFRWQFARDCACDFLESLGVRSVAWDPESTHVLEALATIDVASDDDAARRRAHGEAGPRVLPGFSEIKTRLEGEGRYLRLRNEPPGSMLPGELDHCPVVIGLDVGSTMAKAVVAAADTGEVLRLSASSNAGDTIETVKRLWRDLRAAGAGTLRVRAIGVTGSARYQVQQALARIHPELADRAHALVENYAHARGSIDEARAHVARLAERGIDVNRELCVLVDIGGEDTKISTIALDRGELFANAMNLKCSAGTGSLMDTLASLFGLDDAAAAAAEAGAAPCSRAIDATCAVFLMEHARKLQADGVPRAEILASADWAIVENMARTLWTQIELPARAVVLLHGQTMLSDPLPLAVTERLQAYVRGPVYALVPPHPGHRACLGLVRTLLETAPSGDVPLRLDTLLGAEFDKRIVVCRGAACGDAAARCNRTALSARGADGHRFNVTLGGCTAVNDLLGKRGPAAGPAARDAYKEIWDCIASAQPTSAAPDRLVIPRSFCVTEWAGLFAGMFQHFGIPVHVDDVREADLLDAQGVFHTDTCAPQMGAVGQFRRLASEPHGVILVPQIEALPADPGSLGLTCTVNQGGPAVACSLAALAHPGARFHQFALQLGSLDPALLCDQVESKLRPVFARYGRSPSIDAVQAAIGAAVEAHRTLRRQAADLAADLAEQALAEGRPVAVVVGREYVLHPGLYDSSVRRLLHDKRMAAIPSYVLDVELDPRFRQLYWRNPQAIVSILHAIAGRTLHTRVRHERLAAVLRRIETDASEALLPVVQVSTFACGPDSVTAHLVAEIMRQRPFLLLQSDAVLKELAHLENRMNTYVKQLELGLHAQLPGIRGAPFEVRRLSEMEADAPPDPVRDVIYLPTMSDNRAVTAVLRAAGFTCLDTWTEGLELRDIVRVGRRAAGDAVCTPLAAVYGDLVRAVEDFSRRISAGDPLVQGRRRLLYFDNQSDGPCRQGQYAQVHGLLARREFGSAAGGPACLPGGGVLQIAVGREAQGFNFGIPEWALYRAYQATIVSGLLQELLFAGAARCRDDAEYARFVSEHRALRRDVAGTLERFTGPGRAMRRVAEQGRWLPVRLAARYVGYRLHGRDLVRRLARFSRRWIRGRMPPPGAVRVHVTGEAFMRVAQAEALFARLSGVLGFQRVRMTVSPLWAYLDYLPEWLVEVGRERRSLAEAAARRTRTSVLAAGREGRRDVRRARATGLLLRQIMARPLYRAARLPMPPPPRELLHAARAVLPTLRPHGELALYVGEALIELRGGVDLVLNLAPSGCMVSSMGEVLTPAILRAAGGAGGRIQSLFSADGGIDDELLEVALLKIRQRTTSAA